jgi:hypothetical protein
VSRSWHDRLLLALTPHQLVWAHWQGGWGKRKVAKGRRDYPPAMPAATGAVATLQQMLAEHGLRQARGFVVLSNHFVRYQMLPWTDAIVSEAELIAYSRQRFIEVHGEAARDWAVCVDRPVYGRPLLSSAIDGGLLESLQACCDRNGLRLVSVTPHLAILINTMRSLLREGSAWFVLREADKLILLLARAGVWEAIATRRATAHLSEEIPTLLERTSRLQGLVKPPRRVYLWGVEEGMLEETGSWRFEHLPQQPPHTEATSMARLCALAFSPVGP